MIARLRTRLAGDFGDVWVEGEIGSAFRSRAGHWYFDLHDADAQLRTVLFRSAAGELPCEPQEGMQVRVHGRVDLYPERGALQLVADFLEPCGTGALLAAFEQLRRRLAAEGLFDPVHKRPLPFLPRRIGLVTSAGGAALHDFLRGLRRREVGAEVLLWDARVSGDMAWREVVRGLHLLASRDDVDVIVIARGGGSLEDLWTFNTEPLARAIFELETPVVSAIGHEVDVVLSDLVADVRAPTPTAAAELVVPDGAALRARVAELRTRLATGEGQRLRALRLSLAALERGLVHPARRLAALDARLVGLRERLGRAAATGRDRYGARLGLVSGRLDALSPLAVLGRGYAIAVHEGDGRILRAAREVAAGAPIRVRLSRGSLRARVTEAVDG